jgi:hypothetical protein
MPWVHAAHAAQPNPRARSAAEPTLAFDRLNWPTLVERLRASEPAVVENALRTASQLLGASGEAVRAASAGAPAALACLAAAPSSMGPAQPLAIRADALRCLAQLAETPQLRDALVADGQILEALRAASYAPSVELRETA